MRLLSMIVLGIGLMSCNKDSMADAYSSRGAEQDKIALELCSNELNKELADLAKTDFATMCQSMAKRIENKQLENNLAFFADIINIGKLMNETQKNNCFFENLLELTYNEKGYFGALKSEGYGVWQWDGQTQAFSKVSNHDTDIIFKFPASDALDGDTACLTITDFELHTGKFAEKGKILENGTILNEMLSQLKFSIRIKDELILTSNISNQFDTDGHFKVVGMTFNPKPFTYNGEMAREANNGYWMLSFNRETTPILEHRLNVIFDQTNLNIPISHLDNNLIIKDINFTTKAHTGEIYNQLQTVEALPENSEARALALASVLNENTTLAVRYTNDNTIIAKVNAVAKLDEESTEQAKWWVDLEMVLSDGSRVSGSEYFDDNLTTFKAELEKLVDEFERKFGI